MRAAMNDSASSTSDRPAAGSPYGPTLRRHWLLEDEVAFLNHGSYGATPKAVLAAQDEWRCEMEREPVRFLDRQRLQPRLRQAAAALASFVGARPQDVAFVENATGGASAVLRSLTLRPGDDVLVAQHTYPAVRNAARHACEQAGANLVEAAVPFPTTDAGAIEAAFAAALTARTKLAVLDHVTSATATIMPIERLTALCRAAGAQVLVDAAHAPGMVELDLPSIGADWIIGNAHKWLFAAKGCGFLWAREEAQATLHPTVISHNFGQGFTAEFDCVGTRDPSAWLSVTAALDFYRAMGDASIRSHNRSLAWQAATLLAGTWRTEIGTAPGLTGAMATVRVPGRRTATPSTALALHEQLWDQHRIEVPVQALAGALWVRISAQIYNGMDDYVRLARALSDS